MKTTSIIGSTEEHEGFNTMKLAPSVHPESLLLKTSLLIPQKSEGYTAIHHKLVPSQWQEISVTIGRPERLNREELLWWPLNCTGCVTVSKLVIRNQATEATVLHLLHPAASDVVITTGTALRLPSRQVLALVVWEKITPLRLQFRQPLPNVPLRLTLYLKVEPGLQAFRELLQAHLDLENWEAIWACREPYPDFDVSLYRALAELAMHCQDWPEAIRRWQDLAARQGTATPFSTYHRLAEAYHRQGTFPGGHPEEERGRGDCDKHKLLARIHCLLQPVQYLEIGVQKGASLALAIGPFIGVDPMPQVPAELAARGRIVALTSDAFFAGPAADILIPPPDLIFIDGMHLYEFVLRDFIQVERLAAPWGLVIIDDIFPVHPAQAERRRRTRAWTGDVWKLYETLQTWRSDLFLWPLDAFPTGLLLIAGLDANSSVLTANYDHLVQHYARDCPPPNTVLTRQDAASASFGVKLDDLLDILCYAREQRLEVKQLKATLKKQRGI